MRFNTRNAYYLRVSSNTILPLYLYLDEQHTSWMSERVLQHVLADLRPLIIPKLIAEDSAHLGPGGSSNTKKGTLDVHRGDTYQFGYFLRNTEPHAVLIKTRRFTAAPPKPKHAPKLHETVEVEAEERNAPKKRGRGSRKGKEPAKKKQNTGKGKGKGKSKGKQKATELESDEEEAIEVSADEDKETAERGSVAASQVAPRRSTRKRNVVTGGYREEEGDADGESTRQDPADEDVEMVESEAEIPQEQASSTGLEDANLIAMDQSEDATPAPVQVKSEQPEPTIPQTTLPTPRPDSPDAETPTPAHPQTEPDAILVDSDEEEKPKPIMKLKYQGFSIGGRCLCVIVEPFPPLPKAARAMSLAPTGLAGPRAPSIAPADFIPSGQQRAKTPLFLPEDDDREVTPAPWQGRVRPPVPLFHNEPDEEDTEDDEEDGGMLAYSQILQSVGEYATGAAEDDDDIEGAVFFGDADENKAL